MEKKSRHSKLQLAYVPEELYSTTSIQWRSPAFTRGRAKPSNLQSRVRSNPSSIAHKESTWCYPSAYEDQLQPSTDSNHSSSIDSESACKNNDHTQSKRKVKAVYSHRQYPNQYNSIQSSPIQDRMTWKAKRSVSQYLRPKQNDHRHRSSVARSMQSQFASPKVNGLNNVRSLYQSEHSPRSVMQQTYLRDISSMDLETVDTLMEALTQRKHELIEKQIASPTIGRFHSNGRLENKQISLGRSPIYRDSYRHKDELSASINTEISEHSMESSSSLSDSIQLIRSRSDDALIRLEKQLEERHQRLIAMDFGDDSDIESDIKCINSGDKQEQGDSDSSALEDNNVEKANKEENDMHVRVVMSDIQEEIKKIHCALSNNS